MNNFKLLLARATFVIGRGYATTKKKIPVPNEEEQLPSKIVYIFFNLFFCSTRVEAGRLVQ